VVGGIIIEVVEFEDRYWVNCRDRQYRNECAIYIKKVPGKSPSFGDRLWWQGRKAFWTPAVVAEGGQGRADIPIPRIGYSGAPHPKHGEHKV
jgi:hypothetical protein